MNVAIFIFFAKGKKWEQAINKVHFEERLNTDFRHITRNG